MRMIYWAAAATVLAAPASAQPIQSAAESGPIEEGAPPRPDLEDYRDSPTDGTVGAGLDHDVRGGAFDETWMPDAAEQSRAAARARAAQVDPDVQVRARQDHDTGSYVYLEADGWVWVPNGARLGADGRIGPQ